MKCILKYLLYKIIISCKWFVKLLPLLLLRLSQLNHLFLLGTKRKKNILTVFTMMYILCASFFFHSYRSQIKLFVLIILMIVFILDFCRRYLFHIMDNIRVDESMFLDNFSSQNIYIKLINI